MKYDYENVLEYVKEQAEEKGREEGLAAGLAEGEAKGELKGRRETAKNLLSIGIPIDKISVATGLSENEIQGL